MELNNRIFKYQNNIIKRNVLSYLSYYGIMYLVVYMQYFFLNKLGVSLEFIRIGLNSDGFISIVGATFFITPIILIIFGIVEYYENFALAFSLSATRKKYYISAIYSNFALSLAFALISAIIFFLDKPILNSLNLNALTDFFIFDTTVDSFIKILLILFGMNISFISIGNFMGTLQYKFGYKFWIAFGLLFAVTMISGIPSLISGGSIISIIVNGIISFAKMMIESIGMVPSIVLYVSIQTIVLYIASFFIIKTVNIGK